MDSNPWKTAGGGQIEFSSSQEVPQSFFSQFIFGASEPTHPPDQMKLVGGQSDSIIYSRSISCFSQLYFEMTVVALPTTESVAVIGLAPEIEPGNLPGRTRGSFGYFSSGRMFLEKRTGPGKLVLLKYGVGDTVGCGLDKSGHLIFTQNGNVCNVKYGLDRLPSERLHPVIGLEGEGVIVKVNMEVINPSGVPEDGKLPWDPMLGNPLGHVILQQPVPQECPFLTLPADVYKVLMSFGVGRVVMELSRAVYLSASPSFKWVSVFEMWGRAPGFYRDVANQTSSFRPTTFGFELRKDGTFKCRSRTSNTDLQKEGNWLIERDEKLQSNLVFLLPSPPQQTFSLPAFLGQKWHPRMEEGFPIELLWKMNCSEDEAFESLPHPKLVIIRKCGIPLEQQTAEVECCSEIVEEIVNSVWDSSTQYQQLGCDVKAAISHRVSRLCMAPPGMTDHEIRIAVAQEIANCDEWNCAFEQAT